MAHQNNQVPSTQSESNQTSVFENKLQFQVTYLLNRFLRVSSYDHGFSRLS